MKARTERRVLKQSHRDIDKQLASIIAQLKRQAGSMFDGQPWGKVGNTGFGDCLIAYGKALTELGESFNSGKLPQWALDQQAAYEASPAGKLARAPDSHLK
jgi:hypothetical protein